MRLILMFLMAMSLSLGAHAASVPDAKQLAQERQQAKGAKDPPGQADIVPALEVALKSIEERESSLDRATQNQRVIDNFQQLSQSLRQQLSNLSDTPRQYTGAQTTDALNQEILQISSQLLDKGRQAQQEQERNREISDSLGQLPPQQTYPRRQLTALERRIAAQQTANTPLAQAQRQANHAEAARLKSQVYEFELAQLSASNRQELARLRAELAQKQDRKHAA